MSINPKITTNDESFEWDGLGGAYHPYLMRQQWLYSMLDPRRDIDRECGYPRDILPRQYRFMYDREGIASRVVDIYPDECWAVDPEVYESEGSVKTPFEQDWEDLCMDGENNPLHYLHRLDVLSGIGRFGVLLIGTDDGLEMSQPLPGLNPDGSPNGKSSGYNVLYFRAYDESMAFILDYERNTSSPRYGRPTFYHLLMANIIPNMMPTEPANVTIVSKIVHWSRVIHAADGRETSEVFGIPRMRKVFNRLCDIRKILGGSGEMFWKGGFPGYSFELSPELTLAGVQVDRDKLDRQLERYANGMQRYLAIVGLQAKSLAPQVANPDPTLTAHQNAIAISIGCPLRIFTGSEQAQLASGQDVRTWNRRLTRRQRRYLSPLMIRPFVDRMVAIGRIRPPASPNFNIHWPDVNMPSAEDQSKIADRQTACLQKYVTGGGSQVIAPREFLQIVMGLPVEQIDIIAKAMKNWVEPIIPPAVQAVETQGEIDTKLQENAPTPTAAQGEIMFGTDTPIMNVVTGGEPVTPWMAIILQGGSFALLTYIVTMLYPKYTKEAREERMTRDRECKDERETRDKAFAGIIQNMQDKTDLRDKELINAIKEQTIAINTIQVRSMQRIEAAVNKDK